MIKDESSTGNRLVGTYRGLVLKHLPHGKCKIYIPGVYAEEFLTDPDNLPTAQPKTPLFAGTNNGNGIFSYPNLSSIVWCTFMNGDANFPVFDSATLGGENAFGQYELIKSKDEEVSERHMITSGKTHMIWYENGKISAIVEDPIRTYCSVDYDQFELENNNTSVENKYSYSISNDIVDRISKNKLSNINCQYVLDNNGDVHGELSTSTHWYNIIDIQLSDQQLTSNGIISIDNRNIMNNDGLIDIGTISTYEIFTNDKKNSSTLNEKISVDNEIKLNVPGHYRDNIKKVENITQKTPKLNLKNQLTGHVYTDKSVKGYITDSTYVKELSNVQDQDKKTNIVLTNIINEYQSIGNGEHELYAELTAKHISSDGNQNIVSSKKEINEGGLQSFIDTGYTKLQTLSNLNWTYSSGSKEFSTIATLTNMFEMSEDGTHTQSIVKNENTVRSMPLDETINIKAKNNIVLDASGNQTIYAKHHKIHSLNGTPIVIKNNSLLQLENEDIAKISLEQTEEKNVNGSPVIDAGYHELINMSTSTANIQIVDNLSEIECLDNKNAKQGLTEIRINNKGNGAYCTIQLNANGIMTINTTNQLNIATTNQVNVQTQTTTITSPTVQINGNTTIDGTLHVTGMTTIDPDAKIGNISFLGHKHGNGNNGSPTTPPIG